MPNILIVDDDTDLLDSQKIYLEGEGYTVEVAISMEEGLEKLAGFKPDLILADLMMEHYDSGFVFCKRVKDQTNGKTIPILMQTGASREMGFSFDAATPEDRKWMKVDEVLNKPVPLEDLGAKIRQYLGDQTSL
jgi:CheY-like chemotaxis protein